MALKEHGDESSVAPVYHTQTLSLEPSLFRATVTFQGFTFEGKAKTKKQARHYAAKEACEYLDIKIS
jgi:dsRNA-specific ribonuclease